MASEGKPRVRIKTTNKDIAKPSAIQVTYDSYGHISNYNVSALESSQLFTSLTPKDNMRRFLLGSVTAGALMLYGGRQAKAVPDFCTGLGTATYTCNGDQSGGITYNYTGVLTTLNVNTLTKDAQAIFARETGDLTVNVDTGAFAIDTTGTGIYAISNSGKVTVDSKGDITSDTSRGISARNSGSAETYVKNDGKIQSRSDGIDAFSNTGKVTVDSKGDITSDTSRGIFARNFGASETYVKNDGEIQSRIDGIYARSNFGKVTVDSKGDITSDFGFGIIARTFGSGETDVKNDGEIKSRTYGIYAHSTSGKVTVDSKGDITSDGSRGIFARNLGSADTYVKNDGKIQSDSYGIYARSNSGKVTVNSKGDITSDGSHGIFARNFGASETHVKNDGKIQAFSNGIFAYSSSGKVTVDSKGAITSYSDRGIYAGNYGLSEIDVKNDGKIKSSSQGIFARSGSGKVTVNSKGDITSDTNIGIFARSYSSAETYVNNDGEIKSDLDGIDAFSSTGKVTVDSKGDITSDNGRGIVARNSVSGEIDVKNDGKIKSSSQGIFARSSSGKVMVNSKGDITSDTNTGIFAKSYSSAETYVKNDGKIQSQLVGIDANSNSGKVTVNSKGDITSDTSRGIFARNYGSSETYIKNDGKIQSDSYGIYARSNSGKVTVNSKGDITSDTRSGIFARNFGSGEIDIKNDGNIKSDLDGINARSSSGKVTVDSKGDITSDNRDGIYTISTGDHSIKINSGTVNGLDDGVDFQGGAANILTNYGTILGGDKAIEAGTGNETVHNHSIIIGNVDLGAGTNVFINKITGTFRSGAIANLGGGTLTNEGVLTPGGLNVVQNTALTGNLMQTSDGNFVVDIDENGAGNDKITITGTANFSGKVTPNIIDLTSQSGSFVIADATGGVTLAGASVVDTTNINFGLEVIGTELHLTFQPAAILNLITGPLTPNQLATVLNLDAITSNGGATTALQNLINALSGLPNEAAILAALDQLHSEAYLANLPTTLFSNLEFANSMMSCAQYETGANSHLKEGECVWAKISARKFDQNRTSNNIGIDESVTSFTGGMQFELSPNWYLGFAASYEDTNTDIDTRAKTDGYRAQFGTVLKTRMGNTTFALGLTGGFGSFDTKRFINFGPINLVAEGDQDINFGSGHLRLAHSFNMGSWYIKPMINASISYLELEGLQEKGGGAANLTLQDADDWYFSVSPAIEFGGEIKHSSGAIIRPYLRAGITFFENSELAISTSFSGSPAGINPFQITTEFDDIFGDVEVGVNIVSKNGLNIKFNYEGHFGEETIDHTGGVKFGYKF